MDGLKKANVITEYKIENEKIIVKADKEFEEIKENKPLKTIYKLMMNSVYDKFGMNVIRNEIAIDNGEFINNLDMD